MPFALEQINEVVTTFTTHARPPQWLSIDLDWLCREYGLSKEEVIARIKASPGFQGTVRLGQDGTPAGDPT